MTTARSAADVSLMGPSSLVTQPRGSLSLGGGRDRTGIEPHRRGDVGEYLGLGDLEALLVTGRERGDVPVPEAIGERVADRDAPEQREHAGTPYVGITFPHRWLTLLDMHLVEG